MNDRQTMRTQPEHPSGDVRRPGPQDSGPTRRAPNDRKPAPSQTPDVTNATDAARASRPPRPLDLIAAKLTDVGRARPHNEDYVDYYIPPDPQQLTRKGAIYLVADGMGGHQAGEVASRGAIEVVINQYYADPSLDIGLSLVRAFHLANQQIHTQAQADPSKSGMGTTLVAAVILGHKVYVANVGDSRAYLINKGAITQITEDHSWVEEQVRAGLLTPEQARRHPQRNLVTRALGSKPSVDVDLFEGKISPGDRLLLCSDGLTGRVEDQEIAAVAREYPPEEAVGILVAQANERGGNDNISVLIVNAQAEPPTLLMPGTREPARKSWLIPALIGVVVVAALVAGGLAAMRFLSGEEVTDTPTALPLSPTSATTPSPEASPIEETALVPTGTTLPAPTGSPTGPTATLAPTSEDTATPTPTDTLTSVPPTATAPPTATRLPAPTLIEPATDADLRSLVTFKWTYNRALPESAAFQVLIWRDGTADHLGAASPTVQTEQTVDLDFLLPNRGGPGLYRWTVVVVKRDGEQPIGVEAESRRFRYLGAPGPTEPVLPTKIPLPTGLPWTPKPPGL